MIQLNTKLKLERKKAKISQYKLAELVGLTQSQISKIENGKRDLRNNEIIKISKALDINPEEIFIENV